MVRGKKTKTTWGGKRKGKKMEPFNLQGLAKYQGYARLVGFVILGIFFAFIMNC